MKSGSLVIGKTVYHICKNHGKGVVLDILKFGGSTKAVVSWNGGRPTTIHPRYLRATPIGTPPPSIKFPNKADT